VLAPDKCGDPDQKDHLRHGQACGGQAYSPNARDTKETLPPTGRCEQKECRQCHQQQYEYGHPHHDNVGAKYFSDPWREYHTGQWQDDCQGSCDACPPRFLTLAQVLTLPLRDLLFRGGEVGARLDPFRCGVRILWDRHLAVLGNEGRKRRTRLSQAPCLCQFTSCVHTGTHFDDQLPQAVQSYLTLLPQFSGGREVGAERQRFIGLGLGRAVVLLGHGFLASLDGRGRSGRGLICSGKHGFGF
jgi:hypothetical protein